MFPKNALFMSAPIQMAAVRESTSAGLTCHRANCDRQVSLRILKRTKEFGIRKIVGAPISVIAMHISKEFIILIGIASVLGAGMGYYLSNTLLSSIWENYVAIGLLSLLLPVIIIFIFSAITLSGKVIQTARQNPVDALRYE